MKLIGICGSPRNGNTEWILKRLHAMAVSSGITSDLILLRKQDIKACTGCLSCEKGGKERKGICSIKDDMQDIYPRLLEADIIVYGTPVYFEMLSGLLKNFIDRTCPIWPGLGGKSFAGIAVAEEGIGSAIDNLKTYASVCNMKWAGSVTVIAKKPRQVAGDEKIVEKLQRLVSGFKSGAG
ncbi:MAG: flavodoxin family protein [Dehalococcoidia bacterium]|jgi:multimeric flavodoxin WrbA